MSGECDTCGEHTLDCKCPMPWERRWIDRVKAEKMFPKSPKKSFEELVDKNAGCCEFAWNGFVRLYEEGEKRCECKDCKLMEDLRTNPLE